MKIFLEANLIHQKRLFYDGNQFIDFIQKTKHSISTINHTHYTGRKVHSAADEKHSKRSLNIGNAVRVLSEDVDRFFEPEKKVCFEIYRKDLFFQDKTHSLSLCGLGKYKLMVTFGKKLIEFFYRDCHLSINKMYMKSEGSLVVRWRFTGEKRFNVMGRAKHWLLSEVNSPQPQETSGAVNLKVIEGYSFYNFDESGYIKEHIIDDVEPPMQRWNTLKAWFWWMARLPDNYQSHSS